MISASLLAGPTINQLKLHLRCANCRTFDNPRLCFSASSPRQARLRVCSARCKVGLAADAAQALAEVSRTPVPRRCRSRRRCRPGGAPSRRFFAGRESTRNDFPEKSIDTCDSSQINNEDVSCASHEHVVDIIRNSSNVVSLTVVTLPQNDNLVNNNPVMSNGRNCSTLPRRMSGPVGKLPAPAVPRRDPR